MTSVKKTEKTQIIKTSTLKQKVKCYFTKGDDCILEGDKQHNTSSF
jgi:hypothetical protein